MKTLYLFLISFIILNLSAIIAPRALTNIKTFYEYDIDRKEYNQKIESYIKKNRYVALVGLGGIGKSHLAHHFAVTHLGRCYQIIWWIDCNKDIYSQIQQLIQEINTHIKGEKIPDSATSADILVTRLKSYLENNKLNMLLIFDSLTKIELIEGVIFPVEKNFFDFIVTSRFDFSLSSTLKIEPFTRTQSLNYLKKILPHHPERHLEELAELLKDYPLSLTQSAYFLRHHKTLSSQEYLNLYRKNLKYLWKEEERYLSKYRENLASVQSTLRLSLTHLKTDKQLSHSLLILFSILNNQYIPVSFVEEVFKYLGYPPVATQDALLETGLYSYVDIVPQNNSKKGYVFLHEIVQQAILLEKDKASIKRVAEALSQTIAGLLSQERYKLISYSTNNPELIGHFLHFLKKEEELSLPYSSSSLSLKIYLLDYLLYVKRAHQEALELLDTIEPHLSRIEDLNLKARFLSSAGDVISLHRQGTSQKDFYLKSMITMVYSSLENLDPHEIVRLNNTIGQIYLLESNPKGAIKFINHSLKLIKNFPEAEAKIPTYYFAIWLNNELGNYKEAVSLTEEVFPHLSQVSDTAIKFYIYNCKALALLRLKNFKEAKKFAELSIESCRRYFGKYQSDTLAEALSFRAEAELSLGNINQALKDIDAAIAIHNMFYKGSHKIIDQAYASMIKGNCLLMKQKIKEAHSLYTKAYSILESLQISKSIPLAKRILRKLLYTSSSLKERNIFEFYKNVYQENFALEPIINYFSMPKLVDKNNVINF